MKIHPECAIRCQGYAHGDFVCGEFCEKLASSECVKREPFVVCPTCKLPNELAAAFIRECARSTELEADRTELQARVGHLEQAYERLLDDMCDGFKAAGLTTWMSCGDGIRQLRARAESAEKANPARAAIKKAT